MPELIKAVPVVAIVAFGIFGILKYNQNGREVEWTNENQRTVKVQKSADLFGSRKSIDLAFDWTTTTTEAPDGPKIFQLTTRKMWTNEFGGIWLSVSGRNMFLYSAYFDDRNTTPVVRVIANAKYDENFLQKPVFCQLLGDSNILQKAEVQKIDKNPGISRFAAFFVICPVLSVDHERPLAVRILPTKRPAPALLKESRFLSVSYPKQSLRDLIGEAGRKTTRFDHELAVCVNRLHRWHNWLLLALFIEFYLFQGATKFVFYQRSWTPAVDKIFQGLVEILSQPPLPTLDHGNVDPNNAQDSEQQTLILNDCVYYMMGTARRTLVLDLDEFIVPFSSSLPMKPGTLLQLLREEEQQDDGAVAAITFRNVFFHSEFVSPTNDVNVTNEDLTRLIASLRQTLTGRVYVNRFACADNFYQKSALNTAAIVSASVHEFLESVDAFSKVRRVALTRAAKLHLRVIPSIATFNASARVSKDLPCIEGMYELRQSPLANFSSQLLHAMQRRLSAVN